MRRRGTTQEPVPDYHDTARPGYAKSRPAGILANDSGTALNRTTPYEQEHHVNQTTATPTRPANIPPRFAPVPDPLHPREVGHFEADARTTDHLKASAVVDADGRRGVRYFLRLNLEDATATEIRAALDEALEWWFSQETHLDGAEVAR